jgi:hypothetical protein
MFGWLWRRLGLDIFDKNWEIFPDRTEETADPYFPDYEIPGFEIADTSTELPESKRISGTFYRWHRSVLAPPVFPLWRSFLDDDKKWSKAARFAGSEKNCGHHFALAERGAGAEAAHYGMNLAECKMLEVHASIEKVLDLTTASGRRLAYEALVESPDASDPFIAEEIIEEVTGGTILTDRIGYWATRQGYEAILYVATRIIWGPELRAQENMRPRNPWDYDLFNLYEQGFRDAHELNIVVFRGRYLLSRIAELQIDGCQYKNDLSGLSEDEIERKLSTIPEYAAFGAEFQAQKRRTVWPGKISYVDR